MLLSNTYIYVLIIFYIYLIRLIKLELELASNNVQMHLFALYCIGFIFHINISVFRSDIREFSFFYNNKFEINMIQQRKKNFFSMYKKLIELIYFFNKFFVIVNI